jgi:hypothetical protein
VEERVYSGAGGVFTVRSPDPADVAARLRLSLAGCEAGVRLGPVIGQTLRRRAVSTSSPFQPLRPSTADLPASARPVAMSMLECISVKPWSIKFLSAPIKISCPFMRYTFIKSHSSVGLQLLAPTSTMRQSNFDISLIAAELFGCSSGAKDSWFLFQLIKLFFNFAADG